MDEGKNGVLEDACSERVVDAASITSFLFCSASDPPTLASETVNGVDWPADPGVALCAGEGGGRNGSKQRVCMVGVGRGRVKWLSTQ